MLEGDMTYIVISFVEPEPPGVATAFINAAPAGSFRKAKKQSLFLAISMKSVQFTKTNMIQNRLLLIINFFRA